VRQRLIELCCVNPVLEPVGRTVVRIVEASLVPKDRNESWLLSLEGSFTNSFREGYENTFALQASPIAAAMQLLPTCVRGGVAESLTRARITMLLERHKAVRRDDRTSQ
jgi:hypothetical protein